MNIAANNRLTLFLRDAVDARLNLNAAQYYIYKQLSSVRQEVFTHRHDRHQASVSKAVARVVEVRSSVILCDAM
jgi:hypothetical protein